MHFNGNFYSLYPQFNTWNAYRMRCETEMKKTYHYNRCQNVAFPNRCYLLDPKINYHSNGIMQDGYERRLSYVVRYERLSVAKQMVSIFVF